MAERKPSHDMKLFSDEDRNRLRGSQNSSPLKNSPFGMNSGAFHLSSFGARPRVASLYQGRKKSGTESKLSTNHKILVRSRFGGSQRSLVEDDNKKQK